MKKVLSSCLAFLLGFSAFGEITSLKVNAKDSEKNFLSVSYKVASDDWQALSYDSYGFIQENGQLTMQHDGYDAAANGAWLTYKIEATKGYTINSLRVACVGNRLGSFGKAAGASENTVSFKPYISTTDTFGDPLEEVVLPVSTEQYNLDYDFTSALTEGASTYYVKLWVGSSVAGAGFWYDWFQLGTVDFFGTESEVVYNETYVNADYTVASDNWKALSFDTKGFVQQNVGDKQQLVMESGEYDAAANGAWLTYKIDTVKGDNIKSLQVECVGNRLGSFGKAAGASPNTVSFKPYLSTTPEFGDALEEVILPVSTECYNLNYDFTEYLTPETSSYYVKLWIGSSAEGQGFWYDWFQLGTVKISGTETGDKNAPAIIDASGATITIDEAAYTETGSPIKPTPTVVLNETTLLAGTDYIVSYENYIEPGTATLKVTFLGNYSGSATLNYTINALPIVYNEEGLSVKNYVPDQYDYINYWGGIGDIEPEYGDGITTFAHISGLVPMKGQAINMKTSFQLLSKSADEVDGWVTYSFSAEPGKEGQDNTYPYYGSIASGYFLHITNFSTSEAPNCVEVQFVKSIGGATTTVDKFFLDNACTNTGVLANDEIVFNLSLVKGESAWTLSFTNAETEQVLFTKDYANLNERLFINENGQTYFSSAIYEGTGCDGNHWEHRGVRVYNFDAYTLDSSAAVVTLAQTSYEYEEGGNYKPAVTVTIDDVALVKDVDFYVEYKDNKAVGTATAYIFFIGDYAGNEAKTATYEITAKEEPTSEEPSEEPSDEPTSEVSENPVSEQPSEEPQPQPTKKGCKGEAAASLIGLLTLASAILVSKKRK